MASDMTTNDPFQRAFILGYAEACVRDRGLTPEAALVEAAEAWDRKVAAQKLLEDAYEKVMSNRKGWTKIILEAGPHAPDVIITERKEVKP